ncbi:MAG: hypothetical protein ACRD15_18500 [Vicinamibacterales bacterium]
MSQRFEKTPGIQVASLGARAVPMTGAYSALPFWLDGQPKPSRPEMKPALSHIVEASYPRVMDIPLERGRFLRPQDN